MNTHFRISRVLSPFVPYVRNVVDLEPEVYVMNKIKLSAIGLRKDQSEICTTGLRNEQSG